MRIYISLIAALSLNLSACAVAEEKKLPPGKCMVSSECPQQETCRNGVCEDIYYPRREIKPF